MQLNHKVKLITISQHIIAVAGLIYYGFNLASLLTVLFLYFVYFGLGVSGGYHKMISHRSFKTTRLKKYLLLYIGAFSGLGSSVAWSLSHRLHHAFSDQGIDKDPYYPQGGFFPALVAWWVVPRNVPYNPLIIRDLLTDPDQRFLHEHYFKILGTFVLILALINPWLVVFAWAWPNVLGYHAIQAVGVISHTFGSRPYDNKDNSRDNIVVGVLAFGEGFQNTHHKYPGQHRLHKYDIVGWFLERFIIKKEL